MQQLLTQKQCFFCQCSLEKGSQVALFLRTGEKTTICQGCNDTVFSVWEQVKTFRKLAPLTKGKFDPNEHCHICNKPFEVGDETCLMPISQGQSVRVHYDCGNEVRRMYGMSHDKSVPIPSSTFDKKWYE